MSSTDTQGPHISDEQIARACAEIHWLDFDSTQDYDKAIARAVLALAQPEASPTSAPVLAEGVPYDQLPTLDQARMLVEELDEAAERITRYSNNPLDGLLSAAARMIETLSTPPAQEPTAVQEAAIKAARGQLDVAVDLLRSCLGPLEVSAAVIESDDTEQMEALIEGVKRFLEQASTIRRLVDEAGRSK